MNINNMKMIRPIMTNGNINLLFCINYCYIKIKLKIKTCIELLYKKEYIII